MTQDIKMDFVSLMIHGKPVTTHDELLLMMPRSYNREDEGIREFYRVGKFTGYVAAWDHRLDVGYVRDDYRNYIMEERAKRSER